MPEPSWPRGMVPGVDLRAWDLVAGGGRSPRGKRGWRLACEAAVLMHNVEVRAEARRWHGTPIPSDHLEAFRAVRLS